MPYKPDIYKPDMYKPDVSYIIRMNIEKYININPI